MDNPTPTVYPVSRTFHRPTGEVNPDEVFNLIRDIQDPEHPLTLEQLNIVKPELIQVSPNARAVDIVFVPTVPHCSMSTLIGLMIRVKCARNLPEHTKLTVTIQPGTHFQEAEINKQLNDKERTAAAVENPSLLSLIESHLY
jgi:metal-sulfur cluster biosynthetic enzyme